MSKVAELPEQIRIEEWDDAVYVRADLYDELVKERDLLQRLLYKQVTGRVDD